MLMISTVYRHRSCSNTFVVPRKVLIAMTPIAGLKFRDGMQVYPVGSRGIAKNILKAAVATKSFT